MRIASLSEAAAKLQVLPAAALLLLALPLAVTRGACTLGAACGASRDIPVLVYTAAEWLALGVLLLWMRRRAIPFAALTWTRPRGADRAWGAAGCLFGVFVVYPVAQGINVALGVPMFEKMQHPTLTPPGFAIQFLYAVVSAPLVEETLFRAYAINFLRARGLHAVPASLLALLAFAAIHWPAFGPGGALFIALWALPLSALYLWRGTLAGPALMHAMNNVLAYFIFPLLS